MKNINDKQIFTLCFDWTCWVYVSCLILVVDVQHAKPDYARGGLILQTLFKSLYEVYVCTNLSNDWKSYLEFYLEIISLLYMLNQPPASGLYLGPCFINTESLFIYFTATGTEQCPDTALSLTLPSFGWIGN